MKVLTIFGTRPEAIKLFSVLHQLEKHPQVKSRICVTAQHREMLDPLLKLFNITPDWDLNLMRQGQSPLELAARALQALEPVLTEAQPDLVLVQGDTTTALAGALAASHLRIKVGHVEAGLRTHNLKNPFPEEMNRKLIDALSDFCFAPTERTKNNLLREGIPSDKISVTGNTGIDALLHMTRCQSENSLQKNLAEDFQRRFKISLQDRRLILVTGHRRENFGKALENICLGLKKIAAASPECLIIYPVHLNPNVYGPVHSMLKGMPNIFLIPPLEYDLFIWLMNRALLILTDSGGIQEEAPSLGKPVLVMRQETERREAIEAGISKLVGADAEKIFTETQKLLTSSTEYSKMARVSHIYGDGQAAHKIVQALLQQAK